MLTKARAGGRYNFRNSLADDNHKFGGETPGAPRPIVIAYNYITLLHIDLSVVDLPAPTTKQLIFQLSHPPPLPHIKMTCTLPLIAYKSAYDDRLKRRPT